MEAALVGIKSSQVRYRAREPKPEVVTRTMHSFLSSPIEEYCLALLLQHPELKENCQGLSPEYFENSENREIFVAWQQTNDIPSLKGELDIPIHEYLNSLITKSLPATQIEQKWTKCTLRLREAFLRSLEAKRREVLAQEAESKGTAAELAKLEEQGIEVSIQLREIFTQKRQRRSVSKEVGNELKKQ